MSKINILLKHRPQLKIGMVLARDLAWQRKYEITHINRVADSGGSVDGTKYNDFVVCLRYLGQYYDDGRSKPSPKMPEREVLFSVWDNDGLPRSVDGYRVDRKWDGSRLKN